MNLQESIRNDLNKITEAEEYKTALEHYIGRYNRWEGSANPVAFPLSQKDVDHLGSQLDSHLSPENLHADGEISPAKARQRLRYYKEVYKDIEAYCKKNQLNTPVLYEL
jgi:hypothetical protein